MVFESINPTTGQSIKSYNVMNFEAVREIIEEIHQGFLLWRKESIEQRSEVLKAMSKTLRDRKNPYAELITEEMGKPIVQARAEIVKCASVCDFYAEHAHEYLAPRDIQTEATKSYVAFEPLGIVFAIMPWNFPFWQVFRFLAPALMAGNAGILKHSPNVTGCALAIEDVIKAAGYKRKIFQTLIIDNDAAASVIKHSLVRAVTLTGSTRAGKSVAATAGSVLKKVVLELGGSDPYIILKDANLADAVPMCVASRLTNAGQSCVSAKRFIVVEPLKKQFEEMFVAQMRLKKMGDPMSEDTDIGPMARFDLRDSLHRQVEQTLKDGAKLLLGGQISDDPGAFYPPTVLSDVKKGMLAYEEELFGPVAIIITVQDEEEAITVANDSPYGLGSAIFSMDEKRAEIIAREKIDAGCCFVNSIVRSDPRLPFGGVKESGYGRELSSFGIREFVNIKTVYVA
ncbi:NAD-dependent succinate-semialdehyde dehydrogenase [PVC group bacterium]|nr:NAD-dependent succinate-semialdehyde dehydrogenase [PVC group bacterium]